jgi:mannosyl-oligosaccharide alpha-1,2-mannosidase
VFSVIGVAYLPELKASNVYRYIKPPDNLGPDLLGLVPPIDSHNTQLNPHTARAKLEDKQKLNFKIKQDFNISQLNAVLPKPNINGFMPQDTQRHDLNDNFDNNNNNNNNNNVNNYNNDNNNNEKKWTPLVLPSGEDPDEEMAKRRNFIKDMMKVSWNNYVTYAWGENELRPVSKKGHSAGIFGTTKLGLYL